jgi:hypothetical protein
MTVLLDCIAYREAAGRLATAVFVSRDGLGTGCVEPTFRVNGDYIFRGSVIQTGAPRVPFFAA